MKEIDFRLNYQRPSLKRPSVGLKMDFPALTSLCGAVPSLCSSYLNYRLKGPLALPCRSRHCPSVMKYTTYRANEGPKCTKQLPSDMAWDLLYTPDPRFRIQTFRHLLRQRFSSESSSVFVVGVIY